MNDPLTDEELLIPLEEQLCFAVYSAGIAFTRMYQPLLSKLGLTYPQYLVMLALWSEPESAAPPTVNALGRRLRLKSNTLTPLLKRLESRGWLRRQRDVDDERVVRITLTASGQELRAQAAHLPGCVLGALGMDSDEAHALQLRILELRDRLEGADEENLETTR
ncbi:MAG: MarR family transcriptional regulator [Myxococcota bacterium]